MKLFLFIYNAWVKFTHACYGVNESVTLYNENPTIHKESFYDFYESVCEFRRFMGKIHERFHKFYSCVLCAHRTLALCEVNFPSPAAALYAEISRKRQCVSGT
jgi:hypothetical protein